MNIRGKYKTHIEEFLKTIPEDLKKQYSLKELDEVTPTYRGGAICFRAYEAIIPNYLETQAWATRRLLEDKVRQEFAKALGFEGSDVWCFRLDDVYDQQRSMLINVHIEFMIPYERFGLPNPYRGPGASVVIKRNVKKIGEKVLKAYVSNLKETQVPIEDFLQQVHDYCIMKSL